MKDYVLGSEEFLISFYVLLESRLATCTPLLTATPSERPLPEEEPLLSPTMDGSSNPSIPTRSGSPGSSDDGEEANQAEEDRDAFRKPMDHSLTAHNQAGRTDLHFLNDLIGDINTIHSMVERNLRARKEKKLTDTSKRLYHLHKNIFERRGTPAQRTHDQEEYAELQRELRLDVELLEAAKNTRIQNFYKLKNG
jgi:hypothetical protein